MDTYLAIDIGASSGRIYAGTLEEGKPCLSVVHRFSNGFVQRQGHLAWDLDALFRQILDGLRKAGTLYPTIAGIAIDTWGVDGVLLDGNGKILGDSYSYRDSRTDQVSCPLTQERLYGTTGIQYLKFNTIYQLLWEKEHHPERLEGASLFLQIPDYLGYLLTGIAKQEYTNATTTNLVDARTKSWSGDILSACGLPSRLFQQLAQPATVLGPLKKEVVREVGFQCEVLHAPSHDTASAVLGSPLDDHSLFLSSGTWSLIGSEEEKPNLSRESLHANYSNEGGMEGTTRYLKNLMGLWMVQSLKKESPEGTSFADIERMADENMTFSSRVDVEDVRFLAPASMIDAIKDACNEKGMKVPETVGQCAAVVYHSLAEGYGKAACELQELTGRKFDACVIVGGGTKDKTLCSLTEKATGMKVVTGSSEGTALGNFLSQLVCRGVVDGRKGARKLLHDKEKNR